MAANQNSALTLFNNVYIRLGMLALLVVCAAYVVTLSTSYNYLRTSLPAEEPRLTNISLEELVFFGNDAYRFQHPASWPITEAMSAFGQEQSVGTMRFIHATKNTNAQVFVESVLQASGSDIMSWPGKLGNAEGTYWAKANEVAGTRAPHGQRVFVIEHATQGFVLAVLPPPPYNEAEQIILKSFTLR